MNRRTGHSLLLLVLYGLISGCVTQPDVAGKSIDIATGHAAATDKLQYWWYARFRIGWPPASDPDFAADLLIADLVIKPLLHAHVKNIRYWRFHRRAVRDNAGHQFSFIFYSDKDTAKNIYASISGDRIVTQLKQHKVLQDIALDNLDNNRRTDIRDTSDKNWSPEIQTAWPAYIMGVSNMWLQLIEQEAGDHGQPATIDALLDKYRTANRKVTALWQTEGQHALLHHLNAIFGYEPLVIKNSVRF
jgi:hypothetical protein